MGKSSLKRRKQHRWGLTFVIAVVTILVVVVAIVSVELNKKYEEYKSEAEYLESQIEAEDKETEDLIEFEKYTNTKGYVQEIAREKLGLVSEDEIIFKLE